MSIRDSMGEKSININVEKDYVDGKKGRVEMYLLEHPL